MTKDSNTIIKYTKLKDYKRQSGDQVKEHKRLCNARVQIYKINKSYSAKECRITCQAHNLLELELNIN